MYCLRRYDRNPKLPWMFAAYSEQVTSVAFELDGKIAATLFIKHVATRDRALKMGWKDETSNYNRHLQLIADKEKKEAALVETFSSSSAKIKTTDQRRKRKK